MKVTLLVFVPGQILLCASFYSSNSHSLYSRLKTATTSVFIPFSFWLKANVGQQRGKKYTQATAKGSVVLPLMKYYGRKKHIFPALAVEPKPEATVQTVETGRLSARGLSQRSSASIDREGGSKTRHMCCDWETLVFSTVAQKDGKHQAAAYTPEQQPDCCFSSISHEP